MQANDTAATTPRTERSGCLVAGCSCKDARFLSPRRAAWIAAIAESRGETANRIVPADPAWAIPLAIEPSPEATVDVRDPADA
jgi:hypothetical protein